MKFTDALLAITIALVWGINFVAAKFGLQHFPPMMLMGLRFAIVALCLVPFYLRGDTPHKAILPMAFVYGLAYHALAFTGLWKGLSVGAGVITVQMHVPFTALLGIWWLKDPLGWRRTAGMAIAFIGLVIVVGSPSVMEHIEGFILVLMSAVCWAVYNIQVKQLKIPVLRYLAWFSCYSAIFLIGGSLIIEQPTAALFTNIPYTAIGSLAYMAVLTTIVGLGLWSHLIGIYSVHQVTPFSMLAPVFGVIGASLMLHEPISMNILIGGTITIIGVTVIALRRPALIAKGQALN